MSDRKTIAPDLETGFALVGTNIKNSWRTEVRSILVEGDPESSDKWAYLTHECRAEAVEPERIFDGRLYDFAVVKSWLGNFNLRHGSYNFGLRPATPTILTCQNLGLGGSADHKHSHTPSP